MLHHASNGILKNEYTINTSATRVDNNSRYLQHCYVTGGSAGLGLALAVLLAKKGAHVTVVARDEARLQKALEEMEVFFISFIQCLHQMS